MPIFRKASVHTRIQINAAADDSRTNRPSGDVLSWSGSLSRPGGLTGAAVRAPADLTGLHVPESAGINIRIQVISFPDPSCEPSRTVRTSS